MTALVEVRRTLTADVARLGGRRRRRGHGAGRGRASSRRRWRSSAGAAAFTAASTAAATAGAAATSAAAPATDTAAAAAAAACRRRGRRCSRPAFAPAPAARVKITLRTRVARRGGENRSSAIVASQRLELAPWCARSECERVASLAEGAAACGEAEGDEHAAVALWKSRVAVTLAQSHQLLPPPPVLLPGNGDAGALLGACHLHRLQPPRQLVPLVLPRSSRDRVEHRKR